MPVMIPTKENRRLNSDYYVEGYATTFDQPYLMFEYDGWKYYEEVDRHSFDECDMSDVLFQFNHAGKVYARTRMGNNKPATMIVEPDNVGLFIAADLSLTAGSRQMFEDIDAGLIHQMSIGFTVAVDEIIRDEAARIITRRILKFKKLYDASAVDLPANPNTEISARTWIDGVIETMSREETAKREQNRKKLKLLIDMEVKTHDTCRN